MFIEKEDLELKKFMTRDKPNKNNHPRIGEINYNFYGSPMIIVDYRNSIDIDVCIINIMKNGKINYYIVYNRSYDKFLKGCMKSPYDLSCCNTGYLGEGYRPKDIPIIYRCWLQMINRSCSVNFKNLCNTYIKVTVDKRFHNFQNFIEWYYQNYYQFPNEMMSLDKDILIKNNKIYSPDTCIFVPQRINILFIKCDKVRGDLPIGVFYSNGCNKYISELRISIPKTKNLFLGTFSNPEEAFYAYKEAKESYIKRVADYYYYEKGGQYIPQYKDIIYPALYRYRVEITD